MHEAEQNLRDKLLRFATSERYEQELARAFELYWDGKYHIDNAPELGQIDHARFIEYYIYDYQLAEYGCSPLELFDEFRGYTLSEEEREVLAEWDNTVFGVFIVVDTDDEGTLLRDIFDGVEAFVVNPELTALPRDCIIVGRVISVLGTKRLSGAVATLPPSSGALLRKFVAAQYDLYRRQHPEGNWRDFFRTECHRLQHLLLEMRRQATAGGDIEDVYNNN